MYGACIILVIICGFCIICCIRLCMPGELNIEPVDQTIILTMQHTLIKKGFSKLYTNTITVTAGNWIWDKTYFESKIHFNRKASVNSLLILSFWLHARWNEYWTCDKNVLFWLYNTLQQRKTSVNWISILSLWLNIEPVINVIILTMQHISKKSFSKLTINTITVTVADCQLQECRKKKKINNTNKTK